MKKFYGVILLVLIIGILGIFYFNRNQSNQSGSTSSSRESNEMTTKELTFESQGNQIYGEFRQPEGAGPFPTVIFSHGFGGNRDQELTLQEELVKNGIAVYAFDFAGGTGYSPGRSEGQMTDMSVLTEQQNLEDALLLMQKQDVVDQKNIFLLGASQGGVVSSLTALAHPNDIRGLALIYPAFSLFDDARERFASVEEIPDTFNLMGLTVGRKYFEDIYETDIFSQLKDYQGPVSIFHGTADNLVPLSYSERAASTFPNADLQSLDGEGHGFSESAQKDVANQLLAFIKKEQQ